MLPALISTSSPRQLAQVGHWAAGLSLELAVQNGKTRLSGKQQTGPITVQRPLYPEPANNNHICHLIVLHPPGGLVEGDTLALQIDALGDTHSVITTPSAGKVYQCERDNAKQIQHFKLAHGAKLEWFPQEMILYERSRSRLTTKVELAGNAQFCGWELLCLGREIAGDVFTQGRVTQTIELVREKRPLLIERFTLDQSSRPQTALRNQDWGLAGNNVLGCFIMTGAKTEHLELAQRIILSAEFKAKPVTLGVTLIEDVLVCRALAQQSRFAKQVFIKIWSQLRPLVLAAAAHQPRIWST